MPNWCQNNLSISGNIEDMKKIMEVIEVGDGEYKLLSTLYPIPEELEIGDIPVGQTTEQMESNIEKFGYKSWYDWCIDKWGTKWAESGLFVGEEYTVDIDKDFAVIAFNFDTAWNPPIQAFDKISKDYPNILFYLYYEETGMAFCGRNIWALGECQYSQEAELISKWFDEEYDYDTMIREELQKVEGK
jgi:hypothetical protein